MNSKLAGLPVLQGPDMSTRARIIVIGIVVLVLGVEIAVRFSGGSKTCVQIINKGDTPIEDLVVSFPGSEIGVGSVPPGESVHVWLSGRRKGTLTLAFKQAGNPTSGFMVDDYDPPFMSPGWPQDGAQRQAERSGKVHGRRRVIDALGPPRQSVQRVDLRGAHPAQVSSRPRGMLGFTHA